MTETPTIGDNAPPPIQMPVLPLEATDEEIAAKLEVQRQLDEAEGRAADQAPKPYDTEAHGVLRQRVMVFADAAGAWKDIKAIGSTAQSERLTDFIRGAAGLAKKVDVQRVKDKKPHDDAGDAVQAAYKPLADVLDRIAKLIKPMQKDWLDREQVRIDAEKEAARISAKAKADEAAAKLAQAAQANDVVGMVEAEKLQKEAMKDAKRADKVETAKAGSASGGGRAMSVRKIAFAIIDSQNAVYMAFRDHPRVVEVLQSLADAEYRAGNSVNGCRRGEKESV